MKVILPVIDNKDGRNTIANGFHNVRYACIYNCDTKNCEWISATEISEKPGNLTLGLKHRGIFSVITPIMPLMALGLFIESGLTVYQSAGLGVEENISHFINNQLSRYRVAESTRASSCGNGCNSCNSSCH